MAGWARLYRKSMKSQVWQNDGLWKTWCWCLLRANHTERIVSVRTGRGTTEVKVGPGQFVYGRKAAAKALRAAPGTTDFRMRKLGRLGNINIQAGTHYSIITVCNWKSYQRHAKKVDTQTNIQPAGNQQPTSNQVGTDKNVLKECLKNGKERKGAAPLPPLPEELSAIAGLWADWIQHRREKRTTLTAKAAGLQIADMQAMGIERAAAALRHSIKNNYTGLFEPKELDRGGVAPARPKLGSRK